MEKKVNHGEVLRKRGRPAGKNRAPLSQEERRARNAQYERERRVELSDAFAELAAAAGCSSSISNADLLATVITQIQQASRVKHSSDLESLRRCNKNLMAQIESLEQQLAEPHEVTVVPVQEEEVADVPRPAKRKRGDFEDATEEAGCMRSIPVPAYSPPEGKQTPPAYSPEQENVPEPTLSPDFSKPYLEPEVDQLAEPDFVAYYERSLITEPAREYEDMALQYPDCSAVPTQEFLPAPRIAPLNNSTGQLPGEQASFDISAYNFAGVHITTPEYHITADSAEYILPEELRLRAEYILGPSLPDQPSPLEYANPEPHSAAAVDQQQPTEYVVSQPSVTGSVEIVPIPQASTSAGAMYFEQDHLRLSDEFISAYY